MARAWRKNAMAWSKWPSRRWLRPVPSSARLFQRRADLAGDGQRLAVVVAGPNGPSAARPADDRPERGGGGQMT
jgi:hypothetical protein